MLPAAATQHTAAGASAFLRYWFAALTYAYNTGDTSLMDAVSLPECTACASFTTDISHQYASGGYYQIASMNVGEVEASEPDAVGSHVVFAFSPDPLHIVDGSGESRTATDPPDPAAYLLAIWDDGRWMTSGIAKKAG